MKHLLDLKTNALYALADNLAEDALKHHRAKEITKEEYDAEMDRRGEVYSIGAATPMPRRVTLHFDKRTADLFVARIKAEGYEGKDFCKAIEALVGEYARGAVLSIPKKKKPVNPYMKDHS